MQNIFSSLAHDVRAGKITLHAAAVELARAGYNFGIACDDYARRALHV